MYQELGTPDLVIESTDSFTNTAIQAALEAMVKNPTVVDHGWFHIDGEKVYLVITTGVVPLKLRESFLMEYSIRPSEECEVVFATLESKVGQEYSQNQVEH